MTESAPTALQLLEEAARYADSAGKREWAKSARAAIRAATPPATALPGREEIARKLYETDHRHLKNCWAWSDGGLDDEHPGRRDMYFKYADAILALLSARAASVEAEPVAWRDAFEAELDKIEDAAKRIYALQHDDENSNENAIRLARLNVAFARDTLLDLAKSYPSPAPDAGAEEERK